MEKGGTAELSDWARDRFRVLARAWGVTETVAVDRVLAAFLDGEAAPVSDPDPVRDWTRVRASYGTEWVEGLFDPESARLAITSGELAGRRFKSPSGAARAVVRFFNPDVKANRNGWAFWTVAETGRPLESLRRHGQRPE